MDRIRFSIYYGYEFYIHTHTSLDKSKFYTQMLIAAIAMGKIMCFLFPLPCNVIQLIFFFLHYTFIIRKKPLHCKNFMCLKIY